MISKEEKCNIISKIESKDKKILFSNIIDRANLADKTGRDIPTDFLDIGDLNTILPYLNKYKIAYEVIRPNSFMEKVVLIFGNGDISYNLNVTNYISCLKISTNSSGKLKHKDYMGAIYSLGIKREKIGDIFVYNDCGYVICIPSIKEYILLNLITVGKEKVSINEIDISSEEFMNISINFVSKEIIIPSLRLDTVISKIYNVSRNEVKQKIQSGDVFVNYVCAVKADQVLKQLDIVSVRGYGKFSVDKTLRQTKNANIVVNILKYN